MKHGGTDYVGIADRYNEMWAPKETGIWRMDLESGESRLLASIYDMAKEIYSHGLPSDTLNGHLYIFREGWNPAGSRFITFVKQTREGERAQTWGYTMDTEGNDIRFIYDEPSHHYWVDNETVVDWGKHIPPATEVAIQGYHVFKDDNSGKSKEMFWEATNGHDSYHQSNEWILTDTYNLDGYQYLYLYHLKTKSFVPLGKFKFMLNGEHYFKNAGIFRIDLHPRFSPDGRRVAFDSSHDGIGRQVYVMDIGYMIDHPPIVK